MLKEYLEVLQDVPTGWDDPGWPIPTQDPGTAWQEEERSVVLRVPSVIVPEEFNCLINPEHSRFSELEIDMPLHLPIDHRLF